MHTAIKETRREICHLTAYVTTNCNGRALRKFQLRYKKRLCDERGASRSRGKKIRAGHRKKANFERKERIPRSTFSFYEYSDFTTRAHLTIEAM